MASPSPEDTGDVLLSCRYGELKEVQDYVDRFGIDHLSKIRDDNGNTVLHMICANGHTDLLEFILPISPSSLLLVQNKAGSTALHWAALNQQLLAMQKLIQSPEGPGVDLIDIKNDSGRSPLAEAEMFGWDEGAKWLVEVMNLDDTPIAQEEDTVLDSATKEIQVEIEDAEGKVAKMMIQGSDLNLPQPPPENA